MSVITKIKSWLKNEGIVLSTETSLMYVDGFLPENFVYGIEIYNDTITPMPFVISTFRTVLNFKENDAIETMVKIHAKGGIIIPFNSLSEAQIKAQAINAAAQKHHYPLTCRAISIN